jgi:hypothetical protein
VVHTPNPSTQEAERQEDPEFEASLCYITRLCFKKTKTYKKKKTLFSQYLNEFWHFQGFEHFS